MPDPYPYGYAAGYFNQRSVQDALGVQVNFTQNANAPAAAVLSTGDAVRANISNLEYVLKSGVRVAMIHGDRDYRCNCKSSSKLSNYLRGARGN